MSGHRGWPSDQFPQHFGTYGQPQNFQQAFQYGLPDPGMGIFSEQTGLDQLANTAASHPDTAFAVYNSFGIGQQQQVISDDGWTGVNHRFGMHEADQFDGAPYDIQTQQPTPASAAEEANGDDDDNEDVMEDDTKEDTLRNDSFSHSASVQTPAHRLSINQGIGRQLLAKPSDKPNKRKRSIDEEDVDLRAQSLPQEQLSPLSHGPLGGGPKPLPARPKPGRKPQLDMPVEKRKQQNRQAQRNFRERKNETFDKLKDQLAALTAEGKRLECDLHREQTEHQTLKAAYEKLKEETEQERQAKMHAEAELQTLQSHFQQMQMPHETGPLPDAFQHFGQTGEPSTQEMAEQWAAALAAQLEHNARAEGH